MASEASDATATRLVRKIEAAFRPLCEFPLSRPARELLAPGLRVTFEGRYGVYYTHDDHEVVIVRVLDGARDAAALAEQGGFA